MRIDKLKFNLKLKSKAIGKHRLNETMIHVMRMCQHCAIRIVIETKGETRKNRLAYLWNAEKGVQTTRTVQSSWT